jgi:hypothetical protein
MGTNTFSGSSINYYPALIYSNKGLLTYFDIPAGGDNTGAIGNNGYSFVGNVVNITSYKNTLYASVSFSGLADLKGHGKLQHFDKLICNYNLNETAFKPSPKACSLINTAINENK